MYQIPALDFRGTPTGIDVLKVVEKNLVPFIDTGVAHKQAGVGQVGAGMLSAPMAPFAKAYEALGQDAVNRSGPQRARRTWPDRAVRTDQPSMTNIPVVD